MRSDFLTKTLRNTFQKDRDRNSESRKTMLTQLNSIIQSNKNFNFELSNLILELNQKINVCKQKEDILERFIDEYKVGVS